jgi:hypothetical protein
MQEDGLPRTIRDSFEVKVGGKTMAVDARVLIVAATDLAHRPR